MKLKSSLKKKGKAHNKQTDPLAILGLQSGSGMKRAIISTALILLFITVGTLVTILYAQGYRLVPSNDGRILQGTGLLALSSTPEGARVFIDDELSTATDNTLNLTPGTYTVRIEKEGFFPWRKTIEVKEEEVSQANAVLFPSTPKLEPLTNTGINNTIVDETGTLIAYTVSSSSAQKNGVYVLDMSARPILPIGGLATQLTNDNQAPFSQSQLNFSPDGGQLIASISGELGQLTYLLSTKSFNDTPQEISAILPQTELDWQELEELKYERTIARLPRPLRPFARQYFGDILMSPDEDRVLYVASASGALDIIKKPRLKGVNSTPENRELIQGNAYVYDIDEDRNYLIFDNSANNGVPAPHFIWHPGSAHLVYTKDSRINIMEYDAQNNTTIYAGPFEKDFISVWPDGSHLVILTNHNIPNAQGNLYRISLR